MNDLVPYQPRADVLTTCTVHLHGALKTRFGEQIIVPGTTVATAVRNMLIRKPEMTLVLEAGEYRVVRGSLDGGIDLDDSMLHMQIGPSRQIHLFPVAAGGGGGHGGVFKSVLGAVLIVAAITLAVFQPELAPYIAAATLYQIAGTVALFGASLLLGGLSRLISPQPGLGASYLLNGNLNTSLQGTPIPLVYGTCRVGSLVVASSYSAEDYNTTTSNYHGSAPYYTAFGGFSGALDAFDTGNPLPAGAQGKGGGGGGKGGSGGGGVEAPNTLESKSVVRLLDVLSEGPIGGLVNGPQSIFFNNTPLMNANGSWNFRGVTWTNCYGLSDQAPVQGYPATTESISVNEQVFYGTAVILRLESTTATQVRITIELPSLYATNTQNGDINPSQLGLEIDIAEVVGTSVGAYSVAVQDVINGKCTSPYQRSYVFNLPGAGTGATPITAWNVRITKTTPESAVSTTINILYWFAYDLITNHQIIYADTAYIALEIDSEAFGSSLPSRTYEINGIIVEVPANYNAATRTYASTGPGTAGGTWDYATFQSESTSNPAWCLYDFLVQARYGLGLSRTQLETAAVQLYTISQYCDGLVPDGNGATEPRYQLNGVLNQRASAFQIMQAIAATFRGQVYWAGGQVAITADMPQNPVKIYTAANVIGGNFVYEGTSLKTRHTFANCHFSDPTNQYLPGIEPTEVPQQVANRGIFAADILGFGVTSRGLAHRLGNWLLYTENFQTETITFSVSWDSAGVAPGNLILVSDPNAAGIRLAGRLLSGSTTTALSLDMQFTPAGGTTYSATVVLEDGTIEIAVTISSFTNATSAQGAPYTIANLSSALTTSPLAGAVYILQDSAIQPTEWQVVGITETQRGIFEIVAVAYNPNKFTLVENVPTLNISSFSGVPSQLIAALPPPTNVTAASTIAGQGVTTIVRTTVSWTIPNDTRIVQYQVSVVNSEGVTVMVLTPTGTSVVIDNLTPDTYYFAVRSLGTNGSTSTWAYSSAFIVTGKSPNAPPAVTGLTAIGGIRQVYLQWVASTQRDVGYYNIWRSSTTTAPHQPGTLAALIGTISGTAFTDADHQTLTPSTTWNYWVEPVTSTGIVGALSAAVSIEIALILSEDIGSAAINTINQFSAAFAPIGVWTGASLPANPAAAAGANTIIWQANFTLYNWDATTRAWVTAVQANAIGGTTLNTAVSINGSQLVAGSVTAAAIKAGSITSASLATGTLDANNITSGVLNSGVVLGSLANFGTVQITNAQIQNLTVTRQLIADGQISDTASASGSAPAFTVNVDNGQSIVYLSGAAEFIVNTGSNSFYAIEVKVTRTGGGLGSDVVFDQTFDLGGVNAGINYSVAILSTDIPGAAGNFTYTFSWSLSAASGTVYGAGLNVASIQALVIQK